MTWALSPVEPVAVERGMAFVSRTSSCSLESVETPVYPAGRGPELRAARVGADPFMSIRQAARLLGVTATELSAIERGGKTFVDPGDFDRAIRLITLAGR